MNGSLRWKGFLCKADRGMQISLPFTFCNMNIVVNMSSLISVWSPALYKMKSSKSTLSSRVMKQIDFPFVVPVKPELGSFFCFFSFSFFLFGSYFSSRIGGKRNIKLNQYQALQMLFLEQRWSHSFRPPRFLFFLLYQQHLRNLQVLYLSHLHCTFETYWSLSLLSLPYFIASVSVSQKTLSWISCLKTCSFLNIFPHISAE